MKKKPYIFEAQMYQGKISGDEAAIELLLKELEGLTLAEQLHARGVRFVAVNNRYENCGYVSALVASEAKRLLAPIPGFRSEDFPATKNNFLVGLNLEKIQRIWKRKTKCWKSTSRDSACVTLGHEICHTWQLDARNWHRRDYRQIGHLSIGMTDEADEQFCYDFGQEWLRRDENFEEAKEMVNLHRNHGDFSRVFPSHVDTFTV